MQIFENNQTVATIYQRAISLSICKDFAEKQSGKVSMVDHQGSEQENRRRELLSVEVQAQQEKIIAEHGEEHFRKQTKQNFFNRLGTEINSDFDNKEHLYHYVLGIEDACPAILDILSARAASVNQIKDLAASLPWLTIDLISLVNKPQYRKRADVQVTDAKLALSYIGLDNLKLVMPTFTLKHWLPTSTAPYGLMKRKLWNDSLSIALASSVLAKEQGLDEFTAFTTGMLSNIGRLAVTRCYLTKFSEMHKKELRKAFEQKDKRLHNVLSKIETSEELLLEQLVMRSSQLSADLIEKMHFKRLPITEPIFDLAYAESIEKMHPIAQLVAKAKAYIAFRALAKEELIDAEESKKLLNTVNLTPTEIALLKKSDIDHIKLNFN
ncbi:HDOD domain-containing protein [Colwellia psychrerythraea]|uniref:Putative signal transduction protein n=1 Tax=Colwellia psychrerythraea TaxID=28229 RepID=A0A099KEY2_COLPS|nr:HDOD domain-containing protein [Colwellia psychrerythraea]KGJ88865.1 putative signal transduction protein [Colwellia psychrerythraea]